MSNARKLGELIRIRIIGFLREPEAIFWVFAFPIILALVLGFAFKERGIEKQPVGIVAGPGSEELRAALSGAEHLELKDFPDETTARDKLQAGAVSVVIIPRGVEPPQLLFDPARPEGDGAQLRVRDALQRAAGRTDPRVIELTQVKETGHRYIDWLIPGLLGLNVMGTSLYATSYGLVTNRQKKLLKRFLVTPMPRSAYLLSFVGARLIFLLVEASVILLFGLFVLGVPQRGSWGALVVLCLVAAVSFAGMGILIGSRMKTVEGVNGLLNAALLPMWLGSGVFFSYERFPEFLHPVIQAIPLTALNDALREVMLRGAGISAVLPALGIQLAWGAVCYLIGLRIFRWE